MYFLLFITFECALRICSHPISRRMSPSDSHITNTQMSAIQSSRDILALYFGKKPLVASTTSAHSRKLENGARAPANGIAGTHPPNDMDFYWKKRGPPRDRKVHQKVSALGVPFTVYTISARASISWSWPCSSWSVLSSSVTGPRSRSSISASTRWCCTLRRCRLIHFRINKYTPPRKQQAETTMMMTNIHIHRSSSLFSFGGSESVHFRIWTLSIFFKIWHRSSGLDSKSSDSVSLRVKSMWME